MKGFHKESPLTDEHHSNTIKIPGIKIKYTTQKLVKKTRKLCVNGASGA